MVASTCLGRRTATFCIAHAPPELELVKTRTLETTIDVARRNRNFRLIRLPHLRLADYLPLRHRSLRFHRPPDKFAAAAPIILLDFFGRKLPRTGRSSSASLRNFRPKPHENIDRPGRPPRCRADLAAGLNSPTNSKRSTSMGAAPASARPAKKAPRTRSGLLRPWMIYKRCALSLVIPVNTADLRGRSQQRRRNNGKPSTRRRRPTSSPVPSGHSL